LILDLSHKSPKKLAVFSSLPAGWQGKRPKEETRNPKKTVVISKPACRTGREMQRSGMMRNPLVMYHVLRGFLLTVEMTGTRKYLIAALTSIRQQ